MGSTLATFLIPIPSVDWFAQCVNGALSEMLEPINWIERGDVTRAQAVQLANTMYASIQLTNFNPFPPGMIFPFGALVAPEGYLLCDGSLYDVNDYPELFAQIGYYFGGVDDGFRVPDLLNRVVVGAGGTYGLDDSGGAEVVTLVTSEIPTHSHTDTGHQHVYSSPGTTGLALAPGELPVTLPNLIPGLTGSASANLTNTGGDGSHENMQPFRAITYIVYAGR